MLMWLSPSKKPGHQDFIQWASSQYHLASAVTLLLSYGVHYATTERGHLAASTWFVLDFPHVPFSFDDFNMNPSTVINHNLRVQQVFWVLQVLLANHSLKLSCLGDPNSLAKPKPRNVSTSSSSCFLVHLSTYRHRPEKFYLNHYKNNYSFFMVVWMNASQSQRKRKKSIRKRHNYNLTYLRLLRDSSYSWWGLLVINSSLGTIS